MWYVIQTATGREDELAEAVKKQIPGRLYGSCFSVKRELLKRLGGGWQTVTETLFPSYVFLETKRPEQLFYELKRLPEYARILGDNKGSFIPLEEEEEEFFKKLIGGGSRPSVAELTTLDLDESGEIRNADGPLRFFLDRIVKINLRKRFAVVELRFAGRRQTAVMGIRLKKDCGEERQTREAGKKGSEELKAEEI